jgi:hypothetical protein
VAFPTDPLATKVELNLGGTWTDITAYTLLRDRIQITRGRPDESSNLNPSTCRLTFNNRDGRFSPRNPTGPYYGLIGRNTPVRVSVKVGATRLTGSATVADFASTPDSAGLSITGDLDLRADVSRINWSTGGRFVVKSTSPSQISYILDSETTTGKLVLFWSADGTTALSATSTVAVAQKTGRQSVRATLDIDNGAAGRTITFYTGTSVNGPWTQLGDPVVQAGVTGIFDSTAPVRTSNSGTSQVTYAVKILQGIGGTERANPDFTTQADGATSFVDAAGNTWTVSGAATITNRRDRFYGEISSWPQFWDVSQQDVATSVEAAGILRRLGQGAAPLQSALQRVALFDANMRAYWPMEDAEGSTFIASGLPAGAALSISGTPQLAADDSYAPSAALPVLANASFSGSVGAYTGTGSIHVRWFMLAPAATDVDDSVIMRLFTTGTAARWDFLYDVSGGLNLNAYAADGTSILATGAGFQTNGIPTIAILDLVQNGANIDWKMLTYATVSGAGLQFTGTLNSRTVGVATFVQINPGRTLAATVIGHLAVASAIPTSIESALLGYSGETAGHRIERLCSEQGIPFTAVGDLDNSTAMGPQLPRQLLELLAEAEAADLGQIFESRDQLGLAYRTRASRAMQGPLALTYGSLSELTPVEDDQSTRNDITVTRTFGSSARATVDVGPLSTQAPPNGVGRYDDSVELSLASDSQVADQANLRVTLGTIDEPRYPSINVELQTPSFATSSSLTSSALDVDCGDRITVTGTPVWLPPDRIDQHVIGYSETLSAFEYEIDYTCQPARPIGFAGVYDAGSMRWAADSSTLNGAITSGAASASVATATGPLWTTSAGDFPLDIVIAGERITVSNITGTSSPQTFTFSARGVNGVTKAQSSGAAVQIADPTYYAL